MVLCGLGHLHAGAPQRASWRIATSSGRSRDGYRDREAAARPGFCGQGAVVCGGDGRDDGQAKAEAVAGGAAVEPLEGLEEAAEGVTGRLQGVGEGALRRTIS